MVARKRNGFQDGDAGMVMVDLPWGSAGINYMG